MLYNDVVQEFAVQHGHVHIVPARPALFQKRFDLAVQVGIPVDFTGISKTELAGQGQWMTPFKGGLFTETGQATRVRKSWNY